MATMFDGMQVIENADQKAAPQESAKSNRFVNERAMLLVMAATMGLSTMAVIGVTAVSA